MSEVIKKLRDRRQNVWEQAKKLADVASEDNRAFSAEEQSSWDEMNSELDALDRRIKAVVEGEQRAKDTEEAFAKLEGKPAEGETKSRSDGELRSFLRGESGAPRFYDVKPNGPVNFRDLVKGTATAGGDTVPTSFFDRLMEHLIENSALLQTNPTVLNTGSGENIQVPKTTAHSTGVIVGEGAAIPESDPAFGQVTLGAFKYGALIQVARELIDDTGVDLEGYLARQAGRAIGNAFGTDMVTGTGTSEPRGVVTDATVGVTGGTGVVGAFTSDDLIDLFHSVIAPYRASSSAHWVLSDQGVAAARKIKDSTGQYIWQPGLQADQPDVLLGKPVVVDPNVADPALSAKSVVFGDFSTYFVRLAGGVRFERSDEFAFNTDLVTFRALLRADAALVDLTGSVKVFQGAGT